MNSELKEELQYMNTHRRAEQRAIELDLGLHLDHTALGNNVYTISRGDFSKKFFTVQSLEEYLNNIEIVDGVYQMKGENR